MSSVSNYSQGVELGHGGFGIASLVRRLADDRQFVMKDINLALLAKKAFNELTKPDEVLEMARKEADVMSSVPHPNIVRLFEAFAEHGHFYIIMEYCDSGTLHDAIVEARSNSNYSYFDETKICQWMGQLALTLKYLHDRMLLHRDVKSENVFLTSGGRVLKLGDFGISKALEKFDQSAYTGVGTVAYTAPEHCQGRGFTHKSEVWSFGVVFYELAALHLPFRQTAGQSANPMMLFAKICKADPEPLPDRYSAELRQFVCQKLLCKDPNQRPAMAEVAAHPFFETLQSVNDEDDEVATPNSTIILAERESKVEEFLAADLEKVMACTAIDDVYKTDICLAMKEHKLTLNIMKELSDDELLDVFKQIGTRKAVKLLLASQSSRDSKGDTDSVSKGGADDVARTMKKFLPTGKLIRRIANKGYVRSKAKQIAQQGFAVVRDSVASLGQHKQDSSAAFKVYSLYSAWLANAPKEHVEITSAVIAILIEETKPNEITLVCADGHVIHCNFQQNDVPSIEWRGLIELPSASGSTSCKLNYASYDAKSSRIFATILGEPFNHTVWSLDRRGLVSKTSSDLQTFIADSKLVFVGLEIDSSQECLLTCCPMQGEIRMWSLATRQHLGSISCLNLQHGINPYCCSIFRDESDGISLLAVCDTMENCVNLFGRLAKSNFEFIAKIASAKLENPSAPGSVFWPSDLYFDLVSGNLLVADAENRRVQIFAPNCSILHDGDEGAFRLAASPQLIWSSHVLPMQVQRIAATNVQTNPLAIVSLSSSPFNSKLLWLQ